MPRPRSYGSNKGVVAEGPDWTYSQYVLVIALVLFLCLTCFAVGYIMAPIDRPLAPSEQVATTAPVPDVSLTPSSPDTKSTESENITPPKDTPPVITPPRDQEKVVKRPPLSPTEITPLAAPGPTPMVKTSVSLPGTSGQETTSSSLPSTAPTTEATTPAVPTVPTAPTTPTLPDMPATTTTASATPPEPVADPTPPKPVVTPPKPEAPSAAKGSWGIQVAFFDGKDRKQQADTIKQRLKASANQESKVVVSSDGKEYRVVIDGFTTPEAARASCEKLKTKTGFADAWVKRLP